MFWSGLWPWACCCSGRAFAGHDPVKVVVDVQNYCSAIGQVAQASLRSIIGKSELDDLLSNRERLDQGLELMIDNPALDWGVQIDRVEIKDVALPESMKRSMSRQAVRRVKDRHVSRNPNSNSGR